MLVYSSLQLKLAEAVCGSDKRGSNSHPQPKCCLNVPKRELLLSMRFNHADPKKAYETDLLLFSYWFISFPVIHIRFTPIFNILSTLTLFRDMQNPLGLVLLILFVVALLLHRFQRPFNPPCRLHTRISLLSL